jgi:hypothetical protein
MITKRIVICIYAEMCVEMNMLYFWFDSVTNILFNFDVSFFLFCEFQIINGQQGVWNTFFVMIYIFFS